MGAFLEQAKHNESLLDLLDQKFPNDFFDWKITVAFYAMVHYMNEYLESGGRNIRVSDHNQRNCQLNPNCQGSSFPLSEDNFNKFYEIYLKSRAVRYNGIKNRTAILKKWGEDYKLVRGYFNDLKKFIEEDLDQN